jgi:hypothetical protein
MKEICKKQRWAERNDCISEVFLAMGTILQRALMVFKLESFIKHF